MQYLIYETARPAQMRETMAKRPVAYVPFGALEWHGEHAPLGLDGIKARHVCEVAAARTGGVVFPPVYWGAFDTMAFPFTFHFDKKPMRKMVRSILEQLCDWGFRAIALITGHYPPSMTSMLKKECARFNKWNKLGALAIGAPESDFAIGIGYYGDHAAMWETSLMLAIAPELVDRDSMPRGKDTFERMIEDGIMGQDPHRRASAEKGKRALDHIAANIAGTVEAMLRYDEDALDEVNNALAKAVRRHPFQVAKEAFDLHSAWEVVKWLVLSERYRKLERGVGVVAGADYVHAQISKDDGGEADN